MGHHITVRMDRTEISLELHCTEDPQAWCRTETRGQCVYRQYLPEDVLVESYDGPGIELHSAPVEFSWDGESYSWNYSTESDDQQPSTPAATATVVPMRRRDDQAAR
ncbi:hypothetical protein [Mycobacteroides abscessus]|uniref:hypothetical protein n=1 Tax=Mycobacteroides abscessus TaxID=36809 RepID=UPI0009A5E8F3|nr:hypothetical protein [Mycobacteroides abscessus]MDO3032214.1 hypothetical protein [Mycobacteroides abscessus subsp. massiliense]RIR19257.1 hypothetical protein D2E28_23460 [Mycobacteroides abscessus]SKU70831.1 Uncharacterised protein [Mycobacteroides abscessus subsp. massiliense]